MMHEQLIFSATPIETDITTFPKLRAMLLRSVPPSGSSLFTTPKGNERNVGKKKAKGKEEKNVLHEGTFASTVEMVDEPL